MGLFLTSALKYANSDVSVKKDDSVCLRKNHSYEGKIVDTDRDNFYVQFNVIESVVRYPNIMIGHFCLLDNE